ncbi:hypothetical protein DH2020_049232 [Rehmannia glutinosa]|uniref:Uncharacterized protein n=1 Tax=Rehmannia glutinosa TaxID=99300 RepID=A0ABR0U3D4_REHGL
MASEDGVRKTDEDAAVSTIVNTAEEAKDFHEGVKASSRGFLSICKSLVAGGVAGGVTYCSCSTGAVENFASGKLPGFETVSSHYSWDYGYVDHPFSEDLAIQQVIQLYCLPAVDDIITINIHSCVHDNSVQNPHNIKYNGTVQGLKYIWRTEGFRGLYKGNGVNCARIVPNSAVKFFSYEEASNNEALVNSYFNATISKLKVYGFAHASATRLPPSFHFVVDAELNPLLRLGAGACAGIIAMSATYPMDMVRGRITVQTDKSQYRGIFHALKTVFTQEGPRALYKGWLPSVIGVVPYVGLNFAVYESLKDWLIKSGPHELVGDSELSVTTKLACGAAAGTVGQTIAYPLDVIRRRMQMVGWKDAASVVTGDGKTKAPLQYTGMIDAFRKTVRHEGFGALYKGLVPNSVKVVPSIAIAFVTYELVKDILGVEMRISD